MNSDSMGKELWRCIAKRLCTLGPVGFSPVAPGTLGSVFALPLGALASLANPYVYFSFVVFISFLSLHSISLYIENLDRKDPGEIVIDEVVGCLVALGFVLEKSYVWWLAAFLLFRFFDIAKPWPISAIDRKMKNAAGVLLDDVLSGILSGITLLAADLVLS